MMTDETKPSDFKNIRQTIDYDQIKGWAIDADPKNDPTYPMKARTNEEHEGYTWERPQQQEQTAEILKSVERPNLPSVYGTAVPPSGLSGVIRRMAYKYSESDYRRWLPLVMADRVDMVEGIVNDLGKGHVPNIFKERGWTAELKYNRKDFVLKVAAGVALTAAVTALLVYRKRKASGR
jgi:hypothetical protein